MLCVVSSRNDEGTAMKVFLTGRLGSGKSTVLMRVIDRLKAEGRRVGGITTPEPKGVEFMEKMHLTIDPVCGMEIEPEKAYGKVEHEGYVIYFCSRNCQEEFKKNYKEYLSKMKKEEPMKHEHHH